MIAVTAGGADPLDLQYNPRLRIADVGVTFQRWQLAAAAARANLEARLDLPYGPSARERLDFFPAAGRARPLLVFVHVDTGGHLASRTSPGLPLRTLRPEFRWRW